MRDKRPFLTIADKEEVLSRTLRVDLFHLSFLKDPVLVFKPRMPLGLDEDEQEKAPYPEPPLKRVSFSPSIVQCVRAIYPNIAHFFEDNNFPNIDISVYKAALSGREKVIVPNTLTEQRWVWDAHVTDEYWVMEPVRIKLAHRIRIENPGNTPNMETHPFDDAQNELRSVGPRHINFKLLTSSVGLERAKSFSEDW